MLVLGIESSCDETGAALVTSDGTVRSDVVQSQATLHAEHGGVVPELASRDHVRNVAPVVREALSRAGVAFDDVDAIAVTNRPGLVGALLVGVQTAKGIAWGAGKPLVGVDHLMGHLLAVFLRRGAVAPKVPRFPFVALLVSGGHTAIYRVDAPDASRVRELGATRDDAAGEAFDKVAKLLGMPYPGGKHIEALAKTVETPTVRFAKPMVRSSSEPGDEDFYDLSFSGLKTAVLYAVRDAEKSERLDDARAAIARGFQDAAIGALIEKVDRAARLFRRKRIVLGGGVACNVALQDGIRGRVGARGVTVFAPSPRLATDNAAMIAAAGLYRFAMGERAAPSLTAQASLPIPGLVPIS